MALLWLWCRPAITPIRPLAREPPHAVGVALKGQKTKKKKKKNPTSIHEKAIQSPRLAHEVKGSGVATSKVVA